MVKTENDLQEQLKQTNIYVNDIETKYHYQLYINNLKNNQIKQLESQMEYGNMCYNNIVKEHNNALEYIKNIELILKEKDNRIIELEGELKETHEKLEYECIKKEKEIENKRNVIKIFRRKLKNKEKEIKKFDIHINENNEENKEDTENNSEETKEENLKESTNENNEKNKEYNSEDNSEETKDENKYYDSEETKDEKKDSDFEKNSEETNKEDKKENSKKNTEDIIEKKPKNKKGKKKNKSKSKSKSKKDIDDDLLVLEKAINENKLKKEQTEKLELTLFKNEQENDVVLSDNELADRLGEIEKNPTRISRKIRNKIIKKYKQNASKTQYIFKYHINMRVIFGHSKRIKDSYGNYYVDDEEEIFNTFLPPADFEYDKEIVFEYNDEYKHITTKFLALFLYYEQLYIEIRARLIKDACSGAVLSTGTYNSVPISRAAILFAVANTVPTNTIRTDRNLLLNISDAFSFTNLQNKYKCSTIKSYESVLELTYYLHFIYVIWNKNKNMIRNKINKKMIDKKS